ncbi:MAG: Periplasmic (Fe) hydrogenase large subunit [Syntrophomonadaceae bacterium]|nr:Periplasmic (Fe) hydrogenase large subunit [Bacillota bacterium]
MMPDDPSAEQLTAGDMAVNSDCAECKRCLRICPAAKRGTSSLNSVMQNGCVGCGECLSACPRRAISYQDDTALFLEDLRRGTPISLLVAPAVHSQFASPAKLFGFLKQSGVDSIYNVLFYADITIWAYVEVLRRNPGAGLIASPCAAVSRFIQCHLPGLRRQLIPVFSPLHCAAIFLRKYRRAEEKLAFLSPCIAKRAEMRTVGSALVSYNVTLGRLKEYFSEQGIELDTYPAAGFDDDAVGNGRTLGFYGGLRESILPHLPTGCFEKISGPERVYEYLAEFREVVRQKGKLPDLLEAYNCADPCDGGPGTGQVPAPDSLQKLVVSHAGPEAAENHRIVQEMFRRFNRELNLSDFVTYY